MTALSVLIDRVVGRLDGTRHQVVTQLSVGVNSTATAMSFTYQRAALQPGMHLEFPDGEQALIMAGEANPYTVVRGVNGTTAGAHLTTDLVTVGPRWPRQRVLEYMIEEVHSWPDELGALLTINMQTSSADDVVEIPSIAGRRIGRLGFVYVKDGLSRDWQTIDATIVRSADFASGWGLKTHHRLTDELQVEVLVVPDRSTITTATDLVTLGYEQSMEDILLLGVMQRCLAFAEAARSDGAGYEAARNEANPPTAMTQNAEYYRTMRERRLSDEIFRVHSRMPMLRTVMS